MGRTKSVINGQIVDDECNDFYADREGGDVGNEKFVKSNKIFQINHRSSGSYKDAHTIAH